MPSKNCAIVTMLMLMLMLMLLFACCGSAQAEGLSLKATSNETSDTGIIVIDNDALKEVELVSSEMHYYCQPSKFSTAKDVCRFQHTSQGCIVGLDSPSMLNASIWCEKH